VPRLVERGKTILLTTHYMFEADQLCDRLAIIDKGHLVVEGTPTEVKDKFARVQISEITISRVDITFIEQIEAIDGVQRVVVTNDGPYRRVGIHSVPGRTLDPALRSIFDEQEFATFRARPPTLEEAYLSIVSR
jgi:ABC-2 type transport system ATP-binding protein